MIEMTKLCRRMVMDRYHGHMLKAARHDAIVELLRDRPAMRTVDVARNLNVSMATARRDCIALENKASSSVPGEVSNSLRAWTTTSS